LLLHIAHCLFPKYSGLIKKKSLFVTFLLFRSNLYINKQHLNLVADLSDEKIMLMVKDGYLSELTALFDRYHVKLFNFFLHLTSDKAASEDLSQNLFYRIIKYRHSFDPVGGSFKSWVYQMARNVHLDHHKLEQRMPDRFKQVSDHHEKASQDKEGFGEDDFERLHRALQELRPDLRQIIVLSRFEGLKYEEISKMMDISVSAIKVQVHRGIKQLKNIYFSKQ
jgi:RNA polymerase sigma factor (sigma-70 family)